MAEQKNSQSAGNWTGTQAYVLAVICLVLGVAIGYLVRGSASPSTPATSATAQQGGAPAMGMNGTTQPTPDQMKHMADKQAEPILEQLKQKPNDAKLLYEAGNVYYDAQVYQEAIGYYEKSLAADPKPADVRTDMATAIFYLGDTDRALKEIGTVLKDNPTHANALFNQGMFYWRGKMEIKPAIESWKKLLSANPNYEKRQEIEELIAQAEKHMNIKPGQKTTKPAGM